MSRPRPQSDARSGSPGSLTGSRQHRAEGRVYRQRFAVAFEYPVCFTRAALDPANASLVDAVAHREPERRHRLYVTIDSGVARAWPKLADDVARYCDAHAARLELAEAPRVVEGGEASKNSPALVESLQADMRRLAIDRQSFAVCIGGGAVLDAVGYAAATTHRGVRLVRVPTTVLAQCDAGVGVKNGVNAFGAKNFLGTFAPPFAVVNDASFLATLEPRDVRAGMAEAVKVALIRDKLFFEWMWSQRMRLARFEPAALEELVRRAGETHLEHIASAGDPFETGSARPLDFGHWAAHRLESLSGHALRHGEAVAIGMALDLRYASDAGLLTDDDLERACALLEAVGLELWHDALDRMDPSGEPAVLQGLREFREHLGGELTVTLIPAIGTKLEVHAMDVARITRSIAWLRERAQAR